MTRLPGRVIDADTIGAALTHATVEITRNPRRIAGEEAQHGHGAGYWPAPLSIFPQDGRRS